MTFQVNQPDLQVFNPVSARLSEYELQRTDGTLVAVATVSATSKEAVLPLGALSTTSAPVDLVMSLFSGSELLGMARIRDVQVLKEQQQTYQANVRKPLVFVGAALPPETQVGNAIGEGKILDFTTTTADLAHPKMAAAGTPKMPEATSAAAVTFDGTLLLAGRRNMLTIYDTGTGSSVDMPLSFTPVSVAVAARDAAVAVLDPGDATGGGVALLRDVPALHDNVAGTSPMIVRLPGVNPRRAIFSSDGLTLYVLSGGSIDPCDPGITAAANSITQVGVDGQIKQTWTLPDFVSDLGVGSDGSLLLSRSTANQVVKVIPGSDPGTPGFQKLFDAQCPTALRVANGEILVVTSSKNPDFDNAFTLLRGRDDGLPPSLLALGAPTYQVPTETVAPTTGQPMNTVSLQPKSLSAYDMAVTPDGLRTVFASRIRYHQAKDAFTILDIDCTADLDIVEYGLYVVDTASGNASYEPRSQLVTRPASGSDPCIVCDLAPFGTLPIACPSGPGDRASGLAAIFGGP